MRRLSSVREQIAKEHTVKRAVKNSKLEEDDAFKTFVEKLVGMAPERVVEYSKFVSDDKLQGLVDYVILNRYHVKLANLFTVVDLLASQEQLLDMFYNWENKHSQGKESRPFLAGLVSSNSLLKEGLENSNFNLDKMGWINNENYIKEICSDKSNSNYREFEGSLHVKGVINKTALYEACLAEFILYCDGKAYLEIGDSELANLFMQLRTKEQRVAFCVNCVRTLTVANLFAMEEVSKRVANIFNDLSQKEILLNALDEAGLTDKFLEWMNRHEVRTIFVDKSENSDDLRRAQFWPHYIGKGTVFEKNDFALCIHFDGYVVIEFRGKAAGPAFLMTQEYYDDPGKRVKYRFEYGTKDGATDGLRTLLKWQWKMKEARNSKFDGLIQRMPHQDGEYRQHPWEGRFRGWLAEVNIREVW